MPPIPADVSILIRLHSVPDTTLKALTINDPDLDGLANNQALKLATLCRSMVLSGNWIRSWRSPVWDMGRGSVFS